ncbi:MAG: hypothetical protein ACPKPY_05350 [Nitrososphaeraceae archaeon]
MTRRPFWIPLDKGRRLSSLIDLGRGCSVVTEIHVHTHLDGSEVA